MNFDVAFMSDTFLKLLAALPTTLLLFISSILLGGVFALILVTLRVSSYRILNQLAKLYVLFFRGTPMLLQFFLIYYGSGQFEFIRESFLWVVLGSPFPCAILVMSLCHAAYAAEILRGGLNGIKHGEIEAAKSIGMSRWLLLRRLTVPLTIQNSLPAYSTEAILMVKSTALAGLITVLEMTGVAQQIIQRTYRTIEVFICAAVIYLFVSYLIIYTLQTIEKRLTSHLQHTH